MVSRRHIIAWLGATLALVCVSTWLFAAERRGTLPAGHFDPMPHPHWPVTPARADAVRREALIRAGVRMPGPLRGTRPTYGSEVDGTEPVGRVPRSGPAEPLTCRYLAEPPSGTSAKFNCVLDGGEIIKVKYGRNSEIHAETAATRLLASLGYPADEVRIVPRVRCYGCPRFPFLTTQLLSIARVPTLIGPHGYDEWYTDFEWPAVERRFGAPAIETPTTEGWAWFELKSSQAPRADLDALRLLAVLLAHWDNKSENQRLVCLAQPRSDPPGACPQPLAMLQDVGSTFGPSKVSLAAWGSRPFWSDAATCALDMKDMPFRGATFRPVRVSEAGRRLLGDRLKRLSERQVRDLFTGARFAEYAPRESGADVAGWVRAFQRKVGEIADRPPCPDLTSSDGPSHGRR